MNLKGLSVPNLSTLFSGAARPQDASAQEKPASSPAQDPWAVDRFEKAASSRGLQVSCRPIGAGAALLINMALVCPNNGSMTGNWKRPNGIRPQNSQVERVVRGLV